MVFGGEHDVGEPLEGGDAELGGDGFGAEGGKLTDVAERRAGTLGVEKVNELVELEVVADGDLTEGVGGVEEVGEDLRDRVGRGRMESWPSGKRGGMGDVHTRKNT